MGVRKLDTLIKNSAESLGATRLKESHQAPRVIHGESSRPADATGRMKGLSRLADAAVIPLTRIVPDPDQPRKEFDEEDLMHLADSLKARGQLQPIRVFYDLACDHYKILCGERRYRAAKLAGLHALACVVHEDRPGNAELLAIQLVENCVREDLRPIEQAKAFRRLMDSQGWSGRQLGRELGISQASVSRALALLDLPGEVQDLVDAGQIPPATAYELRELAEPDQVVLAGRVVAESLTRPEVLQAARRVIHGESAEDAESTHRKSALPDWRDRPVTSLGLDKGLVKRLVHDEIGTAGEAESMLAGGYLRDDLAWPYIDLKRLEIALAKLREEAGDPDPFVTRMKPAPPTPSPQVRPAGEGRDVPSPFRERPEPPTAKNLVTIFGAPLEWRKTSFSESDEMIAAGFLDLEVVIRSTAGERPIIELLEATRLAVARLEKELGP